RVRRHARPPGDRSCLPSRPSAATESAPSLNSSDAREEPASSALVGEVPRAQPAWFEPDHDVFGHLLDVRGTALRAEIARRDQEGGFLNTLAAQLRLAAHLDAAIRGFVLEDDDACPRVPAEVARLDAAAAGNDIEAAVPPLVPDGREEDAPVAAIRREHGDERQLEEIAEIVGSKILPHRQVRTLPSWDCQRAAAAIASCAAPNCSRVRRMHE